MAAPQGARLGRRLAAARGLQAGTSRQAIGGGNVMMACSGRRTILVGTVVLALAIALVPAKGQMLVYDPSNYAQNVLQAARALQQINNQITSLQNQTQMLLNQARNLA